MRGAGWIFFSFMLIGCAREMDPASSQDSAASAIATPGSDESSVRLIFHRDHFTNLEDFVSFRSTSFHCLGDVTRVFRTSGGDYSSSFSPTWNPPSAIPFEISDPGDYFNPSYKPSFVKNVSVDITRTYYLETAPGTVQTDACSKRTDLILPSPCADFDPGVGGTLAAPSPSNPNATPTPLPTPQDIAADVEGLFFYRVRDSWCQGQGAMQSNEPELSKAYVGGVNLDLERRSIGAHEDLLMLITYQSFVQGASWPHQTPLVEANQAAPLTSDEHTKLRVDLVATGRTLDVLLDRKQPRVIGDLAEFGISGAAPILIRKLVTLEDPFPSLKTESVLVPLSANPLVDRIRIERIRGSYHLYQIDLYLLGNRPPSN